VRVGVLAMIVIVVLALPDQAVTAGGVLPHELANMHRAECLKDLHCRRGSDICRVDLRGRGRSSEGDSGRSSMNSVYHGCRAQV
jgi:hypothetical protein